MYDVTRAALDVARQYPVFPVRIKQDGGKVPALSNKKVADLTGRKVGKGQGGYKAATANIGEVKALFEAAGPNCEIGVPMQDAGLVALDFDTYKQGNAALWVRDHEHLLDATRQHRTGSGGVHVLFQDPGDVDFPGQVAGLPDAEIKHKGFIVWPWPGSRYSVLNDVPPAEMPVELLDVLDAAPGRPGGAQAFSFTPNDATDDDLMAQVQAGENYHDALLTLGMRMANRHGLDARQIDRALRALVEQSQPADEQRKERRQQLLDEEQGELWRMAEGAAQRAGQEADMSDVAAQVMDGAPLMNTRKVMARTVSREEQAPEPQEVPQATKLEALLSSRIEPRQWLHGNYLIKGHMTMTSAPGGMGKSTAVVTELLEIASQRNITGQKLWRPAKVLYLNGEDPHDELVRRMAGSLRHHGVRARDLGENFDFHSGRDHDLVLIHHEDREVVENAAAIQLLRDLIEARGAEVVCLDPLSSFHACNENSNEEMNRLMSVLRRIGHETGVSFHLVHHSVKDALSSAGKTMGAEQSRGASALLDACRVVRTMRLMTKAEVDDYGLPEGAESNHVVVSIGKGNMSRERTGYTFKLAPHDLENGTSVYPDGDSVAVIDLFDRPKNPISEDIDDWGLQQRAARALLMLPTDMRRAKGERGPAPKSWTGWFLLQQTGMDAERDRDVRVIEGLLQRFVEQGLLRRVEQHNSRSGRKETLFEPVPDVIRQVAENGAGEAFFSGCAG